MKNESQNILPVYSETFINTSDSDIPMNYNSFDKINVSEDDKSMNKQSVNLNLLKDSTLKFSLQYYSKVNFSRKEATELQKDIVHFITYIIAAEIKNISLKNCTLPQIKESLNTIFEFCKNFFLSIDTEYKFLKHLETNDFYEQPKAITLNNTVENIILNCTNTIDEKK